MVPRVLRLGDRGVACCLAPYPDDATQPSSSFLLYRDLGCVAPWRATFSWRLAAAWLPQRAPSFTAPLLCNMVYATYCIFVSAPCASVIRVTHTRVLTSCRTCILGSPSSSSLHSLHRLYFSQPHMWLSPSGPSPLHSGTAATTLVSAPTLLLRYLLCVPQ